MTNIEAARYADQVEIYLKNEMDFAPAGRFSDPDRPWLEALGGRIRFVWEDVEAGALAVYVLTPHGVLVDAMKLSGQRRPESTVALVAAFIEAHDR